ncbi:hypothetical protein FX988_01428 [Paraglaciecola mesophila]|uniref:Solute-binding protein family 3/N-terminal domain-containing protein n=1 Tax=Paraglaciecola mesophila TaxID=197222 RepID=A0A857JJ65_9ALTE|nr:hypothetical protein [Paraglaciecola mesophila]QHJ11200.1 hypothetical protein FX988_01428 [Paraglaciecola mesophila]
MLLTYVVLLMTLLFSLQVQSNSAHQLFTINVTEAAGPVPQKSTLRLFKRLYENLDIDPSLVYLPSKRGLAMVNSGEIDAEAYRFASVGQRYANLIRVEEPIGVGNTGFFCVQLTECDLSKKQKIAMLVGFERAKDICTQFALSCEYVASAKSLGKLLDQGLVQSILATTLEGKQIICQAGKDTYFFKLEASLVRYGYHFIHRKHHALAPKLAENLRVMRKQGWLNSDRSLIEQTQYDCGKDVVIL